MVGRWLVERVVHFAPGDLVRDGAVHFGFHDQTGRHYLIDHQRHFLGLIGPDDRLVWTVAARSVFPDIPNIEAELEFPMYVDSLPDGTLVVSNLGNARLYRIDPPAMTAWLLVDGAALGMVDMGNCVVDRHGDIWVNEVTGCRLWTFDQAGRVVRTLGDGRPGFQSGAVRFADARFHWIYDLRRGPDERLYVLDSRNFALRAIDPATGRVVTVAGTGTPGYTGDGGDARAATFGSDPTARYDGPISLALDEAGNAFVGDRFNHVVRMVERATGVITTIAGHPVADDQRPSDPAEADPLRLDLPQISSMDYFDGRLLVPTDLDGGDGDLAVLRTSGA
jgi:hypothetical protein